jgi:transposase
MPKPQSDQPDNQVIAPAPKKAKIVRRDHSPEYKLAIIRQADSCAYGEIGALLRREKLYSSQLTDWRRARVRRRAPVQSSGASSNWKSR